MSLLQNTNTKIKLANGQLINIDDIKVGDWISNKNNFPTHIRGFANIPQREYDRVIRVNNELTCCSNQIFVGTDGFYYVYGGLDNAAYKKMNTSTVVNYITFDMTVANRIFVGIPDSMIRNLEVGSVLMTEAGPKTVQTIEILDNYFTIIPEQKDLITDHYAKDVSEIDINTLDVDEFRLYTIPLIKYLIVGNDASFSVNGYFCVSIPHNDFDYETGILMPSDSYEIILQNGRYIKVPL